MTTSPFDALAIQPDNGGPFEQGDIAVIMKPDGTVRAMNFGNDAKRLRSLKFEDFTPADHIAYEQGRRLLALSMAAGNPQMMAILIAVLDDPTIAGEMQKLAQRH